MSGTAPAWPMVSLIIPVPPEMVEPEVLRSVRAVDYPADRLEVLLCEGRLPPKQRNAAAREATGEYLLFLDDDIRIAPDHLQKLIRLYRADGCGALGGPSLPLSGQSAVEKGLAFSLSSWWGLGPLSGRYRKTRPAADASDRQLILCNQSIRRDIFLGAGGFDERLFPNEENELIDRLRGQGVRFGYHPDLAAGRPVEQNLSSHWKKMVHYGRGRARQLKVRSSLRGWEHLLVMAVAAAGLALILLDWNAGRWLLGAYGLWLAGAALHAAAAFRSVPAGFYAAAAIAGTHIAYCAGFWHGLLGKIQSENLLDGAEVRVHRVRL